MVPPASAARERALRSTARALDLGALGLALVTASIAFLLPSSGVGKCASYPACLAAPPSAALAAHTLLGALLGLAIVGLLVCCVGLRRQFPAALPRALLSLVVVAVMGSIGSGLFTGALPTIFVLVQVGLLAVLLLLLLVTWTALEESPVALPPIEGRGAGAPDP
jgi:hypothetical protein